MTKWRPALGYIYYLRCLHTYKILYVGSSSLTPMKRFDGHLSDIKTSNLPFYKKIRRLQKKYKMDVPIYMQIKEYRVYRYRRTMLNLEKYYIQYLLKKGVKLLNVRHNFTTKCGCGVTHHIIRKSEHFKSEYHINYFKDKTMVVNMKNLQFALSQ